MPDIESGKTNVTSASSCATNYQHDFVQIEPPLSHLIRISLLVIVLGSPPPARLWADKQPLATIQVSNGSLAIEQATLQEAQVCCASQYRHEYQRVYRVNACSPGQGKKDGSDSPIEPLGLCRRSGVAAAPKASRKQIRTEHLRPICLHSCLKFMGVEEADVQPNSATRFTNAGRAKGRGVAWASRAQR